MSVQPGLLMLILLGISACFTVQGYKPVVLIHGIVTGAPSMMMIEEEIMRVRYAFAICVCNQTVKFN